MSSDSSTGAGSSFGSSRTRNWLVRLYPRAWRERYGEEFETLLEECLHSPLDVLDIFLGALDAHLEFPYEMNWRPMNMTNKLRTSILMVFAGYIGFIIGGLSLYGLADDSPMGALMKTDTALSAAWTAIEIGSAVCLLAVVVGGAPLAFTVIRRALTSSRQNLRLLLVPILAFLALVLYGGFAALVAFGPLQIPGVIPAVSQGNFPLGNRLLVGGFMLLFVVGAIASAAAVWKAVSNTEDEASGLNLAGGPAILNSYEFAMVPAVITTLGMLGMLLATLAWGWLAHSALPDEFAQNWGLLLTNTSLSFAVTIAVMACSTALAFVGLARGYAARKPA